MGKGVFSLFLRPKRRLVPENRLQPQSRYAILNSFRGLTANSEKGQGSNMNKKPIIGITGNFMAKAGPRGSYGIGGDYIKSIRMAGGCPVILSVTNDPELITQYIDSIDGFLCPGGADVAPHLYGEDPVRGMSYFNMDQDVFEMQMIKGCVAAKKPVFGVCRGMQVINVAFGGNMIQDIASQTQSVQAHAGSMDARDEPFHWVDLKEGSVIRQLMGSDKIMTNSFHHQAVKDIARGFTVTGTAADGIVEAMECMDKKILAVQFHPENLAQRFEDFVNLFRWLVNSCQ